MIKAAVLPCRAAHRKVPPWRGTVPAQVTAAANPPPRFSAVESRLAFYPRYVRDMLAKHARFARMYWQHWRILRRVERDTRPYSDSQPHPCRTMNSRIADVYDDPGRPHRGRQAAPAQGALRYHHLTCRRHRPPRLRSRGWLAPAFFLSMGCRACPARLPKHFISMRAAHARTRPAPLLRVRRRGQTKPHSWTAVIPIAAPFGGCLCFGWGATTPRRRDGPFSWHSRAHIADGVPLSALQGVP
jgi:hypothetical protein